MKIILLTAVLVSTTSAFSVEKVTPKNIEISLSRVVGEICGKKELLETSSSCALVGKSKENTKIRKVNFQRIFKKGLDIIEKSSSS